jgi:glycogen synthase
MAEPRPPWLTPRWDGRVAILSFSHLPWDQRVQRQCRLVADMGHAPLVIGHADGGFQIGAQLVSLPSPQTTLIQRVGRIARQLPAHVGPVAAKLGFWIEPGKRDALRLLRAARPQLIIANDWPALVVAAAAKSSTGARIHYDSHEFATTEFDHRRWWRLVYKPFVRHLERDGIAAADSVSTVGMGLAAALGELYGLAAPPLVIRNVPDGAAPPEPSATPWPLRLIYHGIVMPHRGLEELIDSAALWATPHSLLIRGQGADSYVDQLKARAASSAAGDRICFLAPTPPGDVISSAARDADVGVFFPPLETIQQRYMLPNKLFEYIGAGLAIAVSPAPDMVDIVERHDVGLISRGWTVADIVEAIDRLTPANVRRWKAASALAAGELRWPRECAPFKARIAQLLTG